MRKLLFTAVAASIMITQTGCFGSFALVKKVYEFNDNASDNKFVKTLLFYALNIVPVYGIAGFLDVVIFNLLEFWTGSNPIAMNEGEFEEQLMTFKGETYKLTATKNQMKFQKLSPEGLEDLGSMLFSEEKSSWSFAKEGERVELMTIKENEVDFNTALGVKTFDLNNLDNMANKHEKKDLYLDLASK